jgi:putative hydrolase of the HAD superfamily
MNYKLICFDAGYTLFRPRRTLAHTLAARLAREGRAPGEAPLNDALEAADQWFWHAYHLPDNRAWASDITIRQVWRQYLVVVLEHLGLPIAPDAWLDAVISAHFQPETYEIYPDVLPTLETLQAHGLLIGVISDWDSQLPRILVGLGIDRYFRFVIASGAVGLAKPSAAIYQLALERGGARARDVLMVGDSYHGDVCGARSAGLDVFLLDRNGNAQVRDVGIIRTLADLVPRLTCADTHNDSRNSDTRPGK